MLLIGRVAKEIFFNQKRYPDLNSERHQYGISADVAQTSFREETYGGDANVGCFPREMGRRVSLKLLTILWARKSPVQWSWTSRFLCWVILKLTCSMGKGLGKSTTTKSLTKSSENL